MRWTAVVAVMLIGVSASAEPCIEPIRPDSTDLHSASYTGNEIRAEFRDYFRDVEVFLNCWNTVGYRVRQESRAAAYDMDRALTRYPSEREAVRDLDGFMPSTTPMVETGALVLDAATGGATDGAH